MNENPYKPPESDIANLSTVSSGAFESLYDLSQERTAKQAFAFYFVYFIVLICLGAISGIITSVVFGGNNETVFVVGSVLGIFCCVGLAVFICIKKSILKSYKSVGIIIVTLVSSAIFGALLGLIPVSYLTTRENKT